MPDLSEEEPPPPPPQKTEAPNHFLLKVLLPNCWGLQHLEQKKKCFVWDPLAALEDELVSGNEEEEVPFHPAHARMAAAAARELFGQ